MSRNNENPPIGYFRPSTSLSDVRQSLREHVRNLQRAQDRSPKVNYKAEEIPALLDELNDILGRLGVRQILQKASNDYTNGQAHIKEERQELTEQEVMQRSGMHSVSSEPPDFRQLVASNYIEFTASNSKGETKYFTIYLSAETTTKTPIRTISLQYSYRTANNLSPLSGSWAIIEPSRKTHYGKIQRKFERQLQSGFKKAGIVKTDSVRRRDFLIKGAKVGAVALGTIGAIGSYFGISDHFRQEPPENPFAPKPTSTPTESPTPTPTQTPGRRTPIP